MCGIHPWQFVRLKRLEVSRQLNPVARTESRRTHQLAAQRVGLEMIAMAVRELRILFAMLLDADLGEQGGVDVGMVLDGESPVLRPASHPSRSTGATAAAAHTKSAHAGASGLANSQSSVSAVDGDGSTAAAAPVREHKHTSSSQYFSTGRGHDMEDEEMEGTPGPVNKFVSSIYLDFGLQEAKSVYRTGLVFQVILKHQGGKGSKKIQRKPRRAKSKPKAGKKQPVGGGLAVSELLTPPATDRDCIAKGGRYDDLVLRFKLPGDTDPPPVAISVRFGIDKLSAAIAASVDSRRSNGKVRQEAGSLPA